MSSDPTHIHAFSDARNRDKVDLSVRDHPDVWEYIFPPGAGKMLLFTEVF